MGACCAHRSNIVGSPGKPARPPGWTPSTLTSANPPTIVAQTMQQRLLRFPLLALLCAGLFIGCDSSDPVDPPSAEDVAGRYSFEAFTFDPNASAIPEVNMLDTLVTGNTSLQIFESGQFQFNFQFAGRAQEFFDGTVKVTSSQVEFDVDNDDQDDQARLRRLFLNDNFKLSRSSGNAALLTADIQKTVNLETFNKAKYEGLTSVAGVVKITARRQTAASPLR